MRKVRGRFISNAVRAALGLGLLFPSLFSLPAGASPSPVIAHQASSLLTGGFPGMVTGSDGNFWFMSNGGSIADMSPAGAIIGQYPYQALAGNMVTGSDGYIWFAASNNSINKVNPANPFVDMSTYQLPSDLSFTASQSSLTLGSDGNIWFVAYDNDNPLGGMYAAASMAPDGTVTTYPLPDSVNIAGSGMTAAHGSLWLPTTDDGNSQLTNVAADGTVTNYSLPAGTQPGAMATGSDGNAWFDASDANGNSSVDSIAADGTVTSYALPSGVTPGHITGGPSSKVWLSTYSSDGTQGIDSVAADGTIATYSLPAGTQANYITTGPNGNVWFDAGNGFIDELPDTASSSTLVQAINAGGGTSGSYSADTDFFSGATYTSSAGVDTSNVADPAPQGVYQSARYGNSFSYTLPGLTPGAAYTLLLHFNEPYFGVGNNGGGVGSRVFNVAVNGQSALSNYDIYKTAGGANRAITEQVPVTADANGKVTVNFTSVTNNAIVSGIQLFNGTLPAQPPHQTYVFSSYINAGGSATGNFAADSQFSGGTSYASSAGVDTSGIANPAPQSVFQTARYGSTFSYTIRDLAPNATYNVRLDFNEPYFGVGNNGGGVGSRVFNVAINGTSELSNFDIYAAASGANVAVAKDFTAASDAQGNLTVQFTSVTNNAIVSGIEVTQP